MHNALIVSQGFLVKKGALYPLKYGTLDKDDEDEPDDWLIWPTSEKRRKRNVVDVTDAGNDDKCPDVGVFDLGACKFGAPLFLSW